MTDTTRPRRRDRHAPPHRRRRAAGTGRLIGGYVVRIVLVPRLRPAAGVHDRVLASSRTCRSSATSAAIKAFLPVGDISLDNYTGVFDRVPFAQFMMNSIVHLRRHRRARASSSTRWRRSPWPGSSSAGRSVVLGDHPRDPDRAVRDAGAAAAVVGQQAALPRTRRLQPGLAGHLPGADHPVHRQRLLDLPLLPVLRLHPEGAGRGREGRRRGLVPHLPQHRHAAVRAGHRDRRDPDLPAGVEPVPVAADGRCRPRSCARSWSASTTSSSSTSPGARSWPTPP